MAEGMFRALTNYNTPIQHPLIKTIDSCGTGAYHSGDQPDSRTLSVLEKKGSITGYRHKARKVRVPSDFLEFDYLIAMDEDNLIDLREMVKRAKKKGLLTGEEVEKCYLYGQFGGTDIEDEVQDPYYGGRDGFEVAFEQVERCGKGLLRHIEEQTKKQETAED
jgi:low molecular weight phosphotyrosine protein phosphatase